MPDEDGVIAAHYRIDPSRPAPSLAGGLRAFTVIDRRDPEQHLVAVETRADLPARPRIPLARSLPPVPFTVMPVEYGPGRDLSGKPGWFVVSDGFSGSGLRVGQPWREAELMAHVLLPASAALAALQQRGLTHRAINPANLFRAGARDPVTLGPFWAAPPGSLQPPVFEPPYMACCLPNGRGEGSIADDVYALGVTILSLALGRVPQADLDDDALIARKMEVGSFNALVGGAALPSLINDLLRGMLAEDPDHRPSPALLLKPEQARARRVAARPPRRSQQALDVGGISVWSARELAASLSLRPERGHALLRNGEVEHWLRRCLGDPQLGMRLEEVTRRNDEGGPNDSRSQGLLVMRSVAVIDPLAPLTWRGIAVQPDGIGAALVGASPEVVAALEEATAVEAVTHFFAANQRRAEPAGLRDSQRDWRGWLSSRGPAGGVKRLIYGMNPLLACTSPLLAGRPVMRAADLLSALDEIAATTDRTRPPIDPHIAAFLAARADPGLSGELNQLTSFASPADRLVVLRLFGRLQGRLHPAPLPGLAGWLLSSGFATLDEWHSRKTRAALQAKVAQAAQEGSITAIVDIVDDEGAKLADRAGAASASLRVRQLNEALQEARADAPRRAMSAQLLGTEIVTGAGLVASLGATLALAFG